MAGHSRRAVVLGGARSVWDDYANARALGSYDLTLVVNDVGCDFPGRIDVWCTLHPELMEGWAMRRGMRGFNNDYDVVTGSNSPERWSLTREHLARSPFVWHPMNSGSSGMFAVHEALHYRGATHVVLCGVPIDRVPHFFNSRPWPDAGDYQEAWDRAASHDPVFRASVRSLSGWTRDLLGEPSGVWWRTTVAARSVLDGIPTSMV